MGLDIWFKDDIASILRAVDEANLSASATGSCDAQAFVEWAPALLEAYREGFAAALVTVTLALGLPLPALSGGTSTQGAGHIREVTRAGTTRLVDSPRR